MSSTAVQNLALGAFPSGFDVSSDLQLFWQFAFGEEYVVNVNSLSDGNLNGSDCKVNFKTTTTTVMWNGTDIDSQVFSTDNYSLLCTVHDPIYACFTLLFICLPGFYWWRFLCSNAGHLWSLILTCWSAPFVIISYPFVFVLSKVILIFHNGEEYKRFCDLLTMWEVRYETRYQLIAQLFIIFTHSNRAPTNLQWWALASSIFALSLPDVDRFNRKREKKEKRMKKIGMRDKIARFVQSLPLFLFGSVFEVLTLALICVFIRYYLPFYFLAGFLVYCSSYCYYKVCCCGLKSAESRRKACMKTTLKGFWIILPIIVLTVIVIVANTCKDMRVYVFGYEHSWDTMYIVSNIVLLNNIYAFTVTCGLIHFLLRYLFVWNTSK